jgi:hypothetical protein
MEIPDSAGASMGFAAGAMGSSLVVAWKSGPDKLTVTRLGPLGELEATSGPMSIPFLAKPTAVIGSPAGNSVVVAWEEDTPSARGKLGRLDCVGGL